MKKATIFLCLLSHENGLQLQNRHFPLSVALISEYLKKNIQNIETFLFKRPSKLNEQLKAIKPDIVMFSNYMWNEKLNCFYAKLIKTNFPNTLIIFGGPNVSSNEAENINFLSQNPFIDILVEGDGELISKILVEGFLESSDIESVKKIDCGKTFAIQRPSGTALIGKNELENRVGLGDVEFDDIPSPYLTGAMDIFFEDGAIPLLESNRGCPYGCTYCQQGTKYFSKVRFYDSSRIKDELFYIANKIKRDKVDITIVEFADPNFGMWNEDTPVFQAIREVQDLFHFPQEVWCSSGKSNEKLLLKNINMLQKTSMMLRAAMQSLNKTTLKAIKRKNLSIDVVRSFASSQDYEELNTYSDVMLGLPMETKESYILGILDLIDTGITEFSMPQTILLKGTPMESDDYIQQYNLKTKYRVIPECDGIYSCISTTQRITENEKIIFENNTMPFQDYLDCRKFNLIIMIFHNSRLLKPVYLFFDKCKIDKSLLIKTIYKHSYTLEFSAILDNYIQDTIAELSDTELSFEAGHDIEALISNKIYKYLAVAFFSHSSLLLDVIDKSLSDLLSDKEIRQELITIVKHSLIDNLDVFNEVSLQIHTPALKELFGKKLELYYSDVQKNRITLLNKIYKSKEDKINKLAYHLRPAHITKKLKYTVPNDLKDSL